ncbi:uncharacterized protein ACN2A1_012159 [Glossina fuscipes fuscipes]
MKRKEEIEVDLEKLERQIFEWKPNLKYTKNHVCTRLRQQIEDSVPIVKLQSLGAQEVEHLRRYELNHLNSNDEVPASEQIQKIKRSEGNTKGSDENMHNSTETIYVRKTIDSVTDKGKRGHKVMEKAGTPLYTCVPDLRCRSMQHISLDSIYIARKMFDLRARQFKKSLKSISRRRQTSGRKRNERNQKYIAENSEQDTEQELSQLLQALMVDPNDAGNSQFTDCTVCVTDNPSNSSNNTPNAKKRKSRSTILNSSAKKQCQKKFTKFTKYNDNSNMSLPLATSVQQAITWIDENENVDAGNGKTVDISGLSTLLPLSVENSTKNSSLQNQEHVAVQRNDQSITNVEEPLIDGNGNVTITNVEVVDINSLPACLSLSVENSTIDLNFQSILQNQEHVAVQRNDQPPINVEEPLMQDTVRSYLLDYSSEAPLDLSLNKTMWNATNCCSMQLRKSADDCAPLDLCVRSSANMVPQINNNNNLNKEQHSLSVNEDVSFTNMLDSPFLGFDEHEFNIHSTITQTSSHASIKEEMQISLKSSTNDDSMRISVSNVNCAIEGKAENGMLFSDNQFGINYNENGENSNPSENKTI